MSELTEAGYPFSITYYTLDGEEKFVERALLRPGLRRDQSAKSKFLISYTNVDTGEHRQFHRSLLMKVNNIQIYRNEH